MSPAGIGHPPGAAEGREAVLRSELGVTVTIAELNRELEQRQQQLSAHEDLSAYAGQWVVLRDGRVIAHNADPAELRRHEGLRDGDVIALVDDPHGAYFL